MEPPTHEELEQAIKWKTVPEAPVPGLFRMEMQPNIDIQAHDGALDPAYRKIHTSFLDFFPVDVLAEMEKISEPSSEAWLRHDEQIDSKYYRDQSDRRDSIRRSGVNDCIEDVKDYQAVVKASFDEVEQPLAGYDVEEEYELFPAVDSKIVVGTGRLGDGGRFVNKAAGSSFVERCAIGDTDYECIKQSSVDNIIIEIRDGKAFYSIVPCVYKFKKAANQ
ncbi:hypothetical protein PAPHI01_1885 [Pancytospora philotis]|nr:hypothetical protein PAPHI01_1885 [Pancytospora philotis]